MKNFELTLLPLFAGLVCSAPAAQGAVSWGTDFSAAQVKAKAEGRLVMVLFTGSDWSGWCKAMHRDVFSHEPFERFARDHLVLVEVDFPREKPQTESLKKANDALANQFSVQSFPTVILLDSAGKDLGMLGYDPKGVKVFLAQVKRLAGGKLRNAAGTGTSAGDLRSSSGGGSPSHATSENDELLLKGVAGPPSRRLALVNHVTLLAGEAANLSLGERRYRIQCLEVREKSVLLRVDGEAEPVELKLREGL